MVQYKIVEGYLPSHLIKIWLKSVNAFKSYAQKTRLTSDYVHSRILQMYEKVDFSHTNAVFWNDKNGRNFFFDF